jgi:hypothetical protein
MLLVHELAPTLRAKDEVSGGVTVAGIVFSVVLCAVLMVVLVVRVFKGKSVATIVIKPDEFDIMHMDSSQRHQDVEEKEFQMSGTTDNEANDT